MHGMPGSTPPFPHVVWQQQTEPAPPDQVVGGKKGEDSEEGCKLRRPEINF